MQAHADCAMQDYTRIYVCCCCLFHNNLVALFAITNVCVHAVRHTRKTRATRDNVDVEWVCVRTLHTYVYLYIFIYTLYMRCMPWTRARARTCRIVWYAVISFCTRDVHAECTRSTRDQPQTAWRSGAQRLWKHALLRTHTRATHVSLSPAALRVQRWYVNGGKWKIAKIVGFFLCYV